MNLGMETECVEYKRSTSEMREGMESIASILNKHGHGTLYFGVRPSDGEVVGQDVSEKTLRDISQKVGELIEPHIYPQIERLETLEGKAYVRVEFSGFETPYACDGRYRIRRADEDIVMSRAKLAEMMRESENCSNPWDSRSSDTPVSAVDEKALRRYVERGVEAKRIPFSYTEPTDVLSRLGLLCEDGMLTNAAAVCFVPSKDIMLKMGVFADSKRVHILDNQQVTGTLFSMVDAAKLYILNNIRRAFVIDGSSLHRREVPEIPMDAVREALFNAFAHRQYEDDSAIHSPGLFPVGFNPEDYLTGEESTSKPRNRLIATTLYRSGDIEIYGTGLQRIKAACDEANVPFSVTQSRHGVHVSFMRSEGIAAGNTPATVDARRQGDARTAILRYARGHNGITTAATSELVGEKDYTARRLLNSMVEEGLLEKTGGRKGRVYKAIRHSH